MIIITARFVSLLLVIVSTFGTPFSGPTNNYFADDKIVQISQNIKCDVVMKGYPTISNTTFNLALSTVFVTAGQQQTFEFTLLGGAVVSGPPSLTQTLLQRGFSAISGELKSFVIHAPGSSGGAYDIANASNTATVLGSQTLVSGRHITLGIYGANHDAFNVSIDTPLGEVTFATGQIAFDLSATAKYGGTKPVPVTVTCPAPKHENIFATMNTNNVQSVSYGIYSGPPIQSVLPSTKTVFPPESWTGSTGVPFSCGFTPGEPFYDLTNPIYLSLTTYSSSLAYAPGSVHTLERQGYVEVYAEAFSNISPNKDVRAYQVTVIDIDVVTTGIANPPPFVGPPVISPITQLPNLASFALPPLKYTLDTNPGTKSVTYGYGAQLNVTTFGADGKVLDKAPLFCSPVFLGRSDFADSELPEAWVLNGQT